MRRCIYSPESLARQLINVVGFRKVVPAQSGFKAWFVGDTADSVCLILEWQAEKASLQIKVNDALALLGNYYEAKGDDPDKLLNRPAEFITGEGGEIPLVVVFFEMQEDRE